MDPPTPTCGTCKHWNVLPPTLGIRQKVTGECRVGPPGVTGFLNQRGEMAGNVTMYPQPAIDFPACACHAPRLALAEG